MLIAAKQSGMSLVEALIALVIAAILVTAAFPLYSAWVQNTQIRTGAEALLNGLQFARSEAVSRNTLIQFEMTGATGWRVSPANDPDTTIQARSAGSGSATAAAVATPGDATVVTFDSMGRRRATNESVATPPIQQIDVNTSIASMTDARRLRITINDGGQVRMCDPDPSVAVGDTRRCP